MFFFSIIETPFVASETESEDEDDIEQIVKANLIEKSLLTPAPDQKLGAWEAHTKVSLNSYKLSIKCLLKIAE